MVFCKDYVLVLPFFLLGDGSWCIYVDRYEINIKELKEMDFP